LALAHDGELPRLLLDAGTGIRQVVDLLDGRPFEGSIVVTHFHWDHIMGLPFFAAGDRPGSRIDFYAPDQGDVEATLTQVMSPPHFPITPKQLRGSWHFRALQPGPTEIEGFSVLALEVPHKGGRTYGYRISDGNATIAYISDHCPTELGAGSDGLGEYHEAALALVEGCNLVFHDAQYTDEELPARASFGHASAGYAVALAQEAGARRVLLFHHDPSRTDDQVDALAATYSDAVVSVAGAAQGMVIDLP
jgi:phosphoribosyl 1,2-cyclic phosphodiesterase